MPFQISGACCSAPQASNLQAEDTKRQRKHCPHFARSFNWLLTGVTVLDAAYCWMDSADWGCRRGYVQLCFTGGCVTHDKLMLC